MPDFNKPGSVWDDDLLALAGRQQLMREDRTINGGAAPEPLPLQRKMPTGEPYPNSELGEIGSVIDAVQLTRRRLLSVVKASSQP